MFSKLGMASRGDFIPYRDPWMRFCREARFVEFSPRIAELSLTVLMPVATRVPPLRIAARPWLNISLVTMPAVRMQTSAPWPFVRCRNPVAGGRDRFEGLGCPEVQRPFLLVRHWVDGDNMFSADQARALDGVHADPADADHQDDVAQADLAGAGGRAQTGLDAARDQAGRVKGKVRVDLDARQLVVNLPFGEGPEHAESREVVPVAGPHPVAAVELVADGDQGAVVAEVLPARRAPAAPPARRDEGGDDVIALVETGDPGPGPAHDAGSLVTPDDGQVQRRKVAGDQVVVAVAQPGGDHLHEDFAVPRIV